MPIVPKILQFSGNLFSARIRVAKVHERTDHFLHPLVVFNKHVSQFLELGSALRMGVAIGSRQGRVEVPGGMVKSMTSSPSGNSPLRKVQLSLAPSATFTTFKSGLG